MSQFTWSLIVLITALAIYWFIVRPRLKARPELAAYYRDIEGYELRLWQRLLARLRGLKTYIVLFAGILISSWPDIAPHLDLSVWMPAEWVSRITQVLMLLGIITRAAGQVAEKRED